MRSSKGSESATQTPIEALEDQIAALERRLRRLEKLTGHELAEPEQKLNKNQEEIRRLEEIFHRYGHRPPNPALLAMWRKKAGSYRKLKELLEQLGIKGHLSKDYAYIAGAVLGEEKRAEAQQTMFTPRYQDGEELDTGWRWSALRGEWVPPEQWAPKEG